ncbi:MAG: CCA tRNA nucleotidyltransferase [Fuerstia sp.]|nr:CCA tRNA nucleotidyltransferase [Fuerstiella sp.]
MDTVRRLRHEGFESLWAGGCVRDQVLGKSPKDYDIATTAKPDDVIRIFGRRRTVAVGASFGVVMVLGPDKSAGQIEVATFRSDGAYLDGRRPSSVMFCRPEEDAKRRDFTINGMFFDPIEETLIDYVGGRDDLALGIVRAIGDPVARFTEDKLRMLRAVRFTATFGFALDAATADAVYRLRQQFNQVSAERISHELKRMLSHETREHSFRLLIQTGLLPEVLPELYRDEHRDADEAGLNFIRQALHHLKSDQFEPALVLILQSLRQPGAGRKATAAVESVCRRLKLSNEETDSVRWLAESLPVLDDIRSRPLHTRKPLLAHPQIELLLQVSLAIAAAENRPATDVEFCRLYVSTLRGDELRPPPLVDGQDLKALNVPQGPAFRILLSTIRDEQLDEILTTRTAALERLRDLVNASPVG